MKIDSLPNLPKLTSLVLGNINTNACLQTDNNKAGMDLIISWLSEKNFNIIHDRYEIEKILNDGRPFDLIFISTEIKGKDCLLSSFNECSSFIKSKQPDVFVVLVDETPICAKERYLQEFEYECLKKFNTEFDSLMFMDKSSFEKVINDYHEFAKKKAGVKNE